MSIDQRLSELGITLPQPAAPVAAYVPAVEQGGLLHIAWARTRISTEAWPPLVVAGSCCSPR